MKRRIALLGLFHETNTFLAQKTRLEDFDVRLGARIREARGDGSPLDGFLTAAEHFDWEVVPIADYRALPGGVVADGVWESFWKAVEERLGEALLRPLDGIFLVLHGAMVSESLEDVEGKLLARLRARQGLEKIPIFGVLDLHANFTQSMADFSNGLVAYRKNPHTDAFETAGKAADLLNRSLGEGRGPATFTEHSRILLPPSATSTAHPPIANLIETADRLVSKNPELWGINVLGGFSFADCSEAGLSFSAITAGPEKQARDCLRELSDLAWTLRSHARCSFPEPGSVLRKIRPETEGPIILVEPSDNIGGGAPGDGTGVLRALLEHPVKSALVVLCDPVSVEKLRDARPGETLSMEIGGRGFSGDPGPVPLEAVLVSRSPGRFQLEDPNSHLASLSGTSYDMGTCAVLRDRWITLLLTSIRTPPFDLGQLRSQGLEPADFQVIAVKAAVAHRRAYDPIAKASFSVETPGPCSSNPETLPYQRLRRPVFPLDP